MNIRWLNQVSGSPLAMGTGLAASKMIDFLSEILRDGKIMADLVGTGTCDAVSVNTTISMLRDHLSNMDKIRGKLDQVLQSKIKLSRGIMTHEILDTYIGHIADAIVRTLKNNGSILFPVDLHVLAPDFPNGGGGHRTVVYIEESSTPSCFDLHYFETGGEAGGKYSLKDVQSFTKASKSSWVSQKVSPESLGGTNERQNGRDELFLRFSEFRVKEISAQKITSILISPLLANFASIEPEVTTQSDLDTHVSQKKKEIMTSIFAQFETVGQVYIPDQILHFSQQGGECEHSSMIAFSMFYLGKLNLNIANSISVLFHDQAIALGSKIVNELKISISERYKQKLSNLVLGNEQLDDNDLKIMKDDQAMADMAVSRLKKIKQL